MDVTDANHASGGQMMNPQHMNLQPSQHHVMPSHPGGTVFVS
jgi:hypothetical protein